MNTLKSLRTTFLEELKSKVTATEPAGLYDPVHYILDLGGKRLRPLLTLMSAEMYGATAKDAMNAAIAVEVFHNFTLLHDDIMDAADLRRGKETVHKKWDVNTGILTGDAMLIMAYRLFEDYDKDKFYQLNKVFSRTALEVCEGQQHDVDFETRDDVSVPEYLNMIKLKTSVLVGCALQMGAIIAGVDEKEQELIYDYGINLGLAFQLMDDYLDAFGDPETFGKEVGGDIRENKKTYLYLKSIENNDCATELKEWFALHFENMTEEQIDEKKETVKVFFEQSGGAKATLDAIESYTQKALKNIEELSIAPESKKQLTDFSLQLMGRKS
ncbi:geranylgeranyl diphosphate synthase type II [Nonlabens dokdonensis]|uniref:Polyprenyl synthetase n=3 Tax=Nonlabens dokdonensis TaxID=328515 RepID=L7W5I6_NONDD|nr:polyprenyl synthetase family protein [Nonlabens dokdonensis]AGC76915.1 polyprenyl synthetase [Nonlabens dokdonensis DSW-6]PZX36821.1 geranylgeranyl diphosphate synthase type II [Nonlabens dokdonensis]